eukprot:763482-Hanusia_phi.AAC.10
MVRRDTRSPNWLGTQLCGNLAHDEWKDHIIPVKISLYDSAGGTECNRALTIMELREHLALVGTALNLPGMSKQC